MEQILDEHPHVRGVFAASLSSTRAARDVMSRRGLSGKVLLVGCDQDRDVEELLRDGEVDAIVAQDAFQIGYRAALELIDMDQGRGVPAQTLIEPHLFTRADIDSGAGQYVLVNYTGWFLNYAPSAAHTDPCRGRRCRCNRFCVCASPFSREWPAV